MKYQRGKRLVLECTVGLFAVCATAVPLQRVENGAIHEAYIQPMTETVSLEAIEQEPPPNILERIPPNPAVELQWIPGYWSWVPQRTDFVWVSGVWRRPPPGRHWISGLWRYYEEGWVWVRGFWSDVPAVDLAYIEEEPPDPVDENVKPPLGRSTIWMPGFWNYSAQTKAYSWLSGHWVDLDQNWVLMPAQYVWRPSGYVLVGSYWDWPIEVRGRAFATVYVPRPQRTEIYEPTLIIESPVIVSTLVGCYPNYSYFLQHHYRSHPTYWVAVNLAPPWWGWDDWWCLSWHDHWGAWWWYTHPGYRQPTWITADICRRIPPPSVTIINQVTIVNAPVIVTKVGVVTPHDIRLAVKKENGKHSQILSANVKVVEKIKMTAREENPVVVNQSTPELRPVGKTPAKASDKIAAVALPRPAAKVPAVTAPLKPVEPIGVAKEAKSAVVVEPSTENPAAKPNHKKIGEKGKETRVNEEKPQEKNDNKTAPAGTVTPETIPPVANRRPKPPIKKHEPPIVASPLKEEETGVDSKSKVIENAKEKPETKPIAPTESKPPIRKPGKEREDSSESKTHPAEKSKDKSLDHPVDQEAIQAQSPGEPKPPIHQSSEPSFKPKSKVKEDRLQPTETKPVRENEDLSKPPIRESKKEASEIFRPPIKKTETIEPRREIENPAGAKVRDVEKRESNRQTVPVPAPVVETGLSGKGIGVPELAPVPSLPTTDDTSPKPKKLKERRGR